MDFQSEMYFSILIVLILGWKHGVLVGATSGVANWCNIRNHKLEEEPIIIAAYAVSGMVAGILNKFGKIGVIIGFFIEI